MGQTCQQVEAHCEELCERGLMAASEKKRAKFKCDPLVVGAGAGAGGGGGGGRARRAGG